MDLRLTFNEDEYNYDKYRPTYPEELLNDRFIFGTEALSFYLKHRR